jgi:excisionase family DNA binding protein
MLSVSDPTPPAGMSLKEAAVYLGFSEATVRRWAIARRIPARRTPGGYWRFDAAELDAYLETLRVIPA